MIVYFPPMIAYFQSRSYTFARLYALLDRMQQTVRFTFHDRLLYHPIMILEKITVDFCPQMTLHNIPGYFTPRTIHQNTVHFTLGVRAWTIFSILMKRIFSPCQN